MYYYFGWNKKGENLNFNSIKPYFKYYSNILEVIFFIYIISNILFMLYYSPLKKTRNLSLRFSENLLHKNLVGACTKQILDHLWSKWAIGKCIFVYAQFVFYARMWQVLKCICIYLFFKSFTILSILNIFYQYLRDWDINPCSRNWHVSHIIYTIEGAPTRDNKIIPKGVP